MIIYNNDERYKIWWKHHPPVPPLITLREGHSAHTGWTGCFCERIKDGESTVYHSIANLWHKDQYVKSTGRRQSFQKLMENFSNFYEPTRKFMWEEYRRQMPKDFRGK